jgi:predicted Zn-dependent peptidase
VQQSRWHSQYPALWRLGLVILGKLTQLRDIPVTESELNKAKEMVKGHLVLCREDSRSVYSWFASQELLLGKIQAMDEVIGIVEAITPKDLIRVTSDLFRSQGLNLAVVGPNPNESQLANLLKF